MITFGKRILLGTGIVMLGYLSTPAHATLMATGVSCSGQGTQMTSQPGYVACSGAWSGNDIGNATTNSEVSSEIFSAFGLTVGSAVDVTGTNTGSSGTLSLPSAETGSFVIGLKAGDAFSLYEFNGGLVTGGISSINFDTLGVGFSSSGKEHYGQGLSHADIWLGGSPPTSTPEPASLALLAAGLAALAWAARRRRAMR
jgi:hypothetical protein